MTCVTKLTVVVRAALIHGILCSEALKILFGQQLVDRMFENKSLHDRARHATVTSRVTQH